MAGAARRRGVALAAAGDGVARLADLLLAVVVVVEHAVGAVGAVADALEAGDGVRGVVAGSLAFLSSGELESRYIVERGGRG